MTFHRLGFGCCRPSGLFSFAPPLASITALLALLIALTGSARAQAQTRYQNTVNERFATISSGPQSSVIVDVPVGATAAAERDQVTAAALKQWSAYARGVKTQNVILLNALSKRTRSAAGKPRAFPISTLLTVRKAGRLVLPTQAGRTRAVGGGTLTFQPVGFSDSDASTINALIKVFYPLIAAVYGAPSWTGTVQVVNTGPLDTSTIPDAQRLAFGAYDVSNSRILLPIFDSPEFFSDALLLNMIHAFHGPAVFQYDAWEQGFARAAAAAVICLFDADIGIIDPTANFLFALLPYYDELNQPPLGNSTFFPASQANLTLDGTAIGKMLEPRLGMSGAAWLKVYIENPQFFLQFNQAYYAQVDPTASPSLAGNVPALRAIASSLLPAGVEGTPWDAWYQGQYILDTSVSVGQKLYAYAIPQPPETSDSSQSTPITLVYFQSLASGDETLLNGTAYATYFDANNARLPTLGGPPSESAVIGANGSTGEGSITTTDFFTAGVDTGRITMDFHVANSNATATTYIPSGLAGDFDASLLGPGAAGTVTVTQTTVAGATQIRTKTGTLLNSAFGVTLGTNVLDLCKTVVTVANSVSGLTETYQTNTGFGQDYAVIRRSTTGGAKTTASMTFPASQVPRLVSFPLQPFSKAADTALGLATTDFLLSYWDPASAIYQTFTPNATVVSPIQPGRGYWLKLEPASGAVQALVSMTGIAPPTDTDFTINCPFGWNLIGTPFASAIDINDVLVQYLQNDAINWTAAVNSSLVAAEPFSFNTTTGAYSATNTLDGTTWSGYWLRVLIPGGVNLLIPAPDSAGSRAKKLSRAAIPLAGTAPSPDWKVELSARMTNAANPMGASATASFGASRAVRSGFDSRYDLESPPPIIPGIAVHFPHTDWGRAAGGRYVADYRDLGESGAAGRATWNVSVETPSSGPALLTWSNVGLVSRAESLTLIDTVNGTRTPLRSRSSYSFTATAGSTRAFQIVAEPARSLPLQVTGLNIVRTRAVGLTGVSINYLVNDPDADVTVTVSTIAGRIVRQLSGAGRSVSSGQQQTLHWDGRSQTGAALAPGSYMLNLTARAADGTTVREIRPVLLLQ